MKKNLLIQISYFCFLILFILIFWGCSSSKAKDPKPLLNIEFGSLNSWINLMPGSPSTFNFSGIISIKNNNHFVVDSIKFFDVKVYQNKQLVYKYAPEIKRLNSTGIKSLAPGDSVLFRFGTKQGLTLNDKINDHDPIITEVSFSFDTFILRYKSDEIKINKVY